MRSSPRKDPPAPPTPRCRVCGDDRVVEEALEDGAALCEEHDDEISRERIRLESKLERASEGVAHLSMQLEQAIHESAKEGDISRLRKRIKRQRSDQEDLHRKLEELQDRCDHQFEEWRQKFEAEDLARVPPEEMPESLPIVEIHRKCWRCGHSESETIQP